MVLRMYKYNIPIQKFYEDKEPPDPPALLREFNLPDEIEIIDTFIKFHDEDVLLVILFRLE